MIFGYGKTVRRGINWLHVFRRDVSGGRVRTPRDDRSYGRYRSRLRRHRA